MHIECPQGPQTVHPLVRIGVRSSKVGLRARFGWTDTALAYEGAWQRGKLGRITGLRATGTPIAAPESGLCGNRLGQTAKRPFSSDHRRKGTTRVSPGIQT